MAPLAIVEGFGSRGLTYRRQEGGRRSIGGRRSEVGGQRGGEWAGSVSAHEAALGVSILPRLGRSALRSTLDVDIDDVVVLAFVSVASLKDHPSLGVRATR